jgi:hypothetical protein
MAKVKIRLKQGPRSMSLVSVFIAPEDVPAIVES